jgi:hypothetical protein
VRGEISSARHAKRHPLDWYVDEFWCAEQLALALGDLALEQAEGLAIWDPCCGMGNTLLAAHDRGLVTYGSDLVENVAYANFGHSGAPMIFQPGDFLETTAAPALCSMIFNPPYSYRKGILEAFVRHALTMTSRRVCILVPNKWLGSQGRYQLFTDHPPQAVLHLCQRPSMPPGDLINAMGKRAFRGGMIDYCWIVWDVKRPTPRGQTRTIWLPPLDRNSEILKLEEAL